MKQFIPGAVLLVLVAMGVVFVSTMPRKETQSAVPNQQALDLFTNQAISGEVRNEASQVSGSQGVSVLCEGPEQSDFNCYEKVFAEITKNEGVGAAFTLLRAEYPKNAYAQSQCHPLAHVIGNTAATLFPDVSEAYTKGDSFCWSGYYHGVLEGVIGRIGYSNLGKEMNTICKGLRDARQYSFDHYNCVHGLGHGVMAVTSNELFQSLETCNILEDPWERTSCWSGAFMENVIIDNKNHYTKYLKPEDPLYPCNAVGEQYKGTCYLMQTSYMLKVTLGDFQKVFDLCGQAETNHQNTCYQSLGRDASGRSLSNAEQTKTTCDLGKNFEQRSNCIIGAVKDFISYFHSDIQAKELCVSLDGADLQKVCKDTAESYATVL
ncbi:MAG: hypothetical protein Q7K38_00920 [Candidatus Wildermuthbacteria bacterium]|nr:hypothetical protein [Candidatus Wildermuthbacteria bacterium]